MTLILPVNHQSHRFMFQCAGAPRVSGFSIHTVAVSPTDTETIADTVEDIMQTEQLTVAGAFASSYIYLGQNTTQMLLSGPQLVQLPANITGTAGPAVPPANCAVLVRKNTGGGGRRNRGRFYLPACYLPENLVDPAGIIDAGSRAEIQGKVSAVLSALDTAGFPMRLLHSSPDDVPTDVISLVVQSRMATQRLRMR